MDKRVHKTKKAIRNAFMTLLAEKDMEKLTMKEIAEAASVDRKTLYNYYKNIDALLEEVENELIGNFEAALNGWKFDSEEDTKAAFISLTEHLHEHMEAYSLLMAILKNSFITCKTIMFLKEKVRAILEATNMPKGKSELAAEYITNGMFAAYRAWFNSDRKQSLEELTVELSTLVVCGAAVYFHS